MQESLRMHSPVTAIGRTLTEPMTIEGYEVPAEVHAIAGAHGGPGTRIN